jgi:predicted GIY-YIG superfamily endonuclease
MRLSAPFRLVCLEFIGPYSDTARREAQIKGLSRPKKEAYAKDPTSLPRLEAGPAIRRKKKKAQR